MKKIALITGASRGIGKAIALQFIESGITVIAAYNTNEQLAENVVRQDPTGKSFPVQMDIGDRESVQEARAKVLEKYDHLDILINNAGLNYPEDFDKISESAWQDILNLNLGGPFRVVQEFLAIINSGGSIINISSVSSQIGGPRTSHYAASKGGLNTLSQNMAIFCAPKGIRVNTVAPGLIESEMANAAKNLEIQEKILLGRLGTPEEVAAVVLFLASDSASYITAQTINVNGGLYF